MTKSLAWSRNLHSSVRSSIRLTACGVESCKHVSQASWQTYNWFPIISWWKKREQDSDHSFGLFLARTVCKQFNHHWISPWIVDLTGSPPRHHLWVRPQSRPTNGWAGAASCEQGRHPGTTTPENGAPIIGRPTNGILSSMKPSILRPSRLQCSPYFGIFWTLKNGMPIMPIPSPSHTTSYQHPSTIPAASGPLLASVGTTCCTRFLPQLIQSRATYTSTQKSHTHINK